MHKYLGWQVYVYISLNDWLLSERGGAREINVIIPKRSKCSVGIIPHTFGAASLYSFHPPTKCYPTGHEELSLL
jgi:hypothetical protein